jgi:ribose transport system ATP-binding protein
MPPAVSDALPVLTIRNLSKTFGATKVLDRVDLTVRPGEVHGLLGKNGSGKSTLVKVLAGFHAPDAGAELKLNGQAVHLPLHAGEFRRLGMSFVHQNLGLIPSLTVLENLGIGDLVEGNLGAINWGAKRKAGQAALDRFGVALDLEAPVARLSPVDRALLAIVRAFEEVRRAQELNAAPGLLLLDEPTPFLPREGVQALFQLIRRVVEQGSSVIFISHDVDEVMEITDRVTVLRDGIVAGELQTASTTDEAVIEAIVGRKVARAGVVARSQDAAPSRPAYLKLRNVTGGAVREVSLDVGKGEVLGLTGLLGSGYEDLPYLVFGARAADRGLMDLGEARGLDLSRGSPAASLKRGMALLPADRPGASGVESLPVADNLFLPSLDRFFRRGVLDRAGMARRALELGGEYEVRPNAPHMPLRSLSGGNAQKVLIARWMSRDPSLLLLDEPTQGVDVGTREQIFRAIRAAAGRGMAVMCASSDYEQLAEISDRVLVFNRGRVTASLTGAALTKDGIADACYASAKDSATMSPTDEALP